LSTDFVYQFGSDMSGMVAFSLGGFLRICRPIPPCLRKRASICLSVSLTYRPTKAGIN